MPGNLPVALFFGFWLVVLLCILVRAGKNRVAPVKIVRAVVTGKNTVETVSKYAGNGKQEKYVVVFSAEGKKLSFYVSAFSYDGYRIGETGTLKYRGDRLIDFS